MCFLGGVGENPNVCVCVRNAGVIRVGAQEMGTHYHCQEEEQSERKETGQDGGGVTVIHTRIPNTSHSTSQHTEIYQAWR